MSLITATIRRQGQWIASPRGPWIYCRLMGLRYAPQSGRYWLTRTRRNGRLELRRDFDFINAIRVFVGMEHVGWVPREIAAVLGPMMDNGTVFMCELIDNNPKQLCIRIKLHPLQNLHPRHPWANQVPSHKPMEDYELENRRHQAGYYNQLDLFRQ